MMEVAEKAEVEKGEERREVCRVWSVVGGVVRPGSV